MSLSPGQIKREGMRPRLSLEGVSQGPWPASMGLPCSLSRRIDCLLSRFRQLNPRECLTVLRQLRCGGAKPCCHIHSLVQELALCRGCPVPICSKPRNGLYEGGANPTNLKPFDTKQYEKPRWDLSRAGRVRRELHGPGT